MVEGAYTHNNKAINSANSDGWQGLNWNDPNVLQKNRGPAGYNTPQIFQMSYIYELPLAQENGGPIQGRRRRFSGGGKPAAFLVLFPADRSS